MEIGAFVALSANVLDSRGQPGGWVLFLSRQEKYPKEGDPAAPALRATLGCPEKSGGCATRMRPMASCSDSARRLPPIFPVSRGGAEGDTRL